MNGKYVVAMDSPFGFSPAFLRDGADFESQSDA